jgi:hypothetical protein
MILQKLFESYPFEARRQAKRFLIVRSGTFSAPSFRNLPRYLVGASEYLLSIADSCALTYQQERKRCGTLDLRMPTHGILNRGAFTLSRDD